MNKILFLLAMCIFTTGTYAEYYRCDNSLQKELRAWQENNKAATMKEIDNIYAEKSRRHALDKNIPVNEIIFDIYFEIIEKEQQKNIYVSSFGNPLSSDLVNKLNGINAHIHFISESDLNKFKNHEYLNLNFQAFVPCDNDIMQIHLVIGKQMRIYYAKKISGKWSIFDNGGVQNLSINVPGRLKIC